MIFLVFGVVFGVSGGARVIGDDGRVIGAKPAGNAAGTVAFPVWGRGKREAWERKWLDEGQGDRGETSR